MRRFWAAEYAEETWYVVDCGDGYRFHQPRVSDEVAAVAVEVEAHDPNQAQREAAACCRRGRGARSEPGAARNPRRRAHDRGAGRVRATRGRAAGQEDREGGGSRDRKRSIAGIGSPASGSRATPPASTASFRGISSSTYSSTSFEQRQVVHEHNLTFKDGYSGRTPSCSSRQAALVLIVLERFVRAVLGERATDADSLHNLLQKATSARCGPLLVLPWDDQQDGIRKILQRQGHAAARQLRASRAAGWAYIRRRLLQNAVRQRMSARTKSSTDLSPATLTAEPSPVVDAAGNRTKPMGSPKTAWSRGLGYEVREMVRVQSHGNMVATGGTTQGTLPTRAGRAYSPRSFVRCSSARRT